MNVNLYLPDELGARAKEAGLLGALAGPARGALSRLLQDAVTDELARRDVTATTLETTTPIELDLVDAVGHDYVGRINATLIAENERNDVEVYLTDKENVVAYDRDRKQYTVINDPETELENWLRPDEYETAMHALGITPKIDLDV